MTIASGDLHFAAFAFGVAGLVFVVFPRVFTAMHDYNNAKWGRRSTPTPPELRPSLWFVRTIGVAIMGFSALILWLSRHTPYL